MLQYAAANMVHFFRYKSYVHRHYLFIYYAFIRSIHMDTELVQVSINLQLQVGYKITT